ncbi:hypothetical protein KOR42_41000 [Thalassoglobus neptunius]|uniref:MetA-pathway of phenol degradation n=1 Tax=Thalassoglobus neptunius TaxID=1938619 RepID=A0A5C5WDW5_9PLAN|nr:transporter [Thalassoglobus neptunius]TWT47902.1 hypothetical protein KOR42_41000 [Thalassoglobus neptunius]
MNQSTQWKLLLLIVLASSSNLHAGEDFWSRSAIFGSGGESEREMETDRDSFTPATTTVPGQMTMIESAWSFVDNPIVSDTNSFPELLVRHGVSDWLEARFVVNYEVGGAGSSVTGGSNSDLDFEEEDAGEIERESSISYGLKAALTQQDEWIPESAFILQASTPMSGPETATSFVSTYVIGWRLANDWLWDSSIRYGYGSAEGDHFNQWAPSTVLKIPFAERWNVHAEYFGVFSDGQEQETVRHFASPGIHCLVTENLEVGIRVGWGLNRQSADFFSNIGFGWQF